MNYQIIVAILIVLSIITTLVSWYYMNHQPIYTLTLSAGKYPTTNDKIYPKTYATNGTCDGVFYGTDQTAVIVMQCSATDYLTSKAYLGVVVSYNGTKKISGILPNITVTAASSANWLGVFDLTPLFTNAAKVSGYRQWSISHWNSRNFLPKINGSDSTNVGFPIATSVKSWPLSVSGNSIVSESGNYGLSLSCSSPVVNVTD
jgi:hypothetical protein